MEGERPREPSGARETESLDRPLGTVGALAMDIVDSAVRLTARDGVLDIDAWLREADKWGVAHAVVAPSAAHVAVLNEEGNRQVADLLDSHGDRISGLAVANPWYGDAALGMAGSAFDRGCRGLYLDPGRQGFRLTEPVVLPLIELCARLGKPVYCHTGTPVFAMPFQLSELARRYPSVPFVMGHAGYSDFWYDVIPAALQSDNVFVECSCTTGGLLAQIIEAVGSGRVLFGSGYPVSLLENELEKIGLVGLDEDARRQVLSGNARALWGLDR